MLNMLHAPINSLISDLEPLLHIASGDVVVDVEYRQVSERLELVERDIALLTSNN